MFPWRLKIFQRLSILRKFGIPNFYLGGLRNIKRLGPEKFGKRGILILSDGVEVSQPFATGNGCRPAKSTAPNCAAEKLKCP
jgi:hypothetical protein